MAYCNSLKIGKDGKLDQSIGTISSDLSDGTDLLEDSGSVKKCSLTTESLGINDLHGEYLEKFEKLRFEVEHLERSLKEYFHRDEPLKEETYRSIDSEYRPSGICGRLQGLINEIETMNITIYVGGECECGKTTLIHALLETGIEPSPTRISCRYTFDSKTRVEFKQSPSYRNSVRGTYQRKKEDSISFQDVEDTEKLHKLINDRTAATAVPQKIYDEAHFYVKSTILKENIFIVDLPGVREPSSMHGKLTTPSNPSNQMVIQCIKNESNAFIFVLNSTRIEEQTPAADNIIRVAYDKLKVSGTPHLRENRSILRNVLFVFNKWDLVEASGKEYAKEQKKLAKQKILDLWPEVNKHQQIYFLSATEVLRKRIDLESTPPKFRDLKQSIKRLVKHILDSNIENHIRFMQYLLNKMETATYEKIKFSLDKYFKRARENRTLLKDLKLLKSQNVPELAKLIMKDFEQYFEITTQTLLGHLKSDIPQERLMKVDVRDRKDLTSMNKITSFIHKAIQTNIKREISHWDSSTKLLSTNLSESFNDCFKMRLEVFGADYAPMKHLSSEELMQLISDQGQYHRSHSSHLDTVIQTVIFGAGVVAQIPFHLVGTLVSIPILAMLFRDADKKEKEMVKLFHDNPEEFVNTRISRFFRRKLTEEILKKDYLRCLSLEYEKCSLTLQEFMNKLIESQVAREKDNQNEVRDIEDILSTFYPHLDKIQKLLSELVMVDKTYRGEACCDSMSSPITDQYFQDNQPFCKGTFADFYRYEDRFCLRVIKEDLSPRNARRYFSEQVILKQMQYNEGRDNFLQFYNPVFCGNWNRQVYLMENCQSSLRDYLRERPHLLPANVLQEDQFAQSFKLVMDLSGQLNMCLVILERYKWGIVHPDLRMENIMVKLNDDIIQLKLCDFANENTCSPSSHIPEIYVAPENRRRVRSASPNLYRVCTASNTYGCGIVMWELYHAVPVSDLTMIRTETGELSAEKTLKFADDERCPAKFKSLITKCVIETPEERPQAVDIAPKLIEIRLVHL